MAENKLTLKTGLSPIELDDQDSSLVRAVFDRATAEEKAAFSSIIGQIVQSVELCVEELEVGVSDHPVFFTRDRFKEVSSNGQVIGLRDATAAIADCLGQLLVTVTQKS